MGTEASEGREEEHRLKLAVERAHRAICLKQLARRHRNPLQHALVECPTRLYDSEINARRTVHISKPRSRPSLPIV